MLTLQGLPGEIFKVKPIGSSDIMSVSCGLKKSLLLRNDGRVIEIGTFSDTKVLGYDTNTNGGIDFADKSTFSDWSLEAIAYVESAKDKTNNLLVMNGMDEGKFEPKQTYTRQQAIITIKRLFSVK